MMKSIRVSRITASRRAFLKLALLAGGAALLSACGSEPAQLPPSPAEPAAHDQQPKEPTTMQLQKVDVNDVELHYVEQGKGDPLILVHGGLADYREWSQQMERFAQRYRVIAYSRRYNHPNQNRQQRPDHSALIEAEDLAAFMGAVGIERGHVVGYSYGAFAALCLALEHPERVRALVLAEPPVHRWVIGLPGGDALFADLMTRLWEPAGQAFRRGDKAEALRVSLDFFAGPGALSQTPPEVRQVLEDNLHEWEALTTSSDAFPMLAKERVAQLGMPTLLMTGDQTLPIHRLVNDEIERVWPHVQRVRLPKATHDMWNEQPDACGAAVFKFLGEHA
jgi:pimeloyl-ACP methyl ester carboxylesterase